ncbi:MAG: ATP-binding protein [Polyangia bacterium]|nr:ATP-binding protein [Polyangia bacterium]
MERRVMGALQDWKRSADRKPLVIRGARQVGKTWLMKELGASYGHCAYVNFEGNPRMKRLFEADFDIERILVGLRVETGQPITPRDCLLVFDEVQEVPRALTALKYFHENAPGYDVIAAGSLLGVALHTETSFPVGKVEFLDLHPMSFPEFLTASDNEGLLQLLAGHDFATAGAFSEKLVDLLRQYLIVGGMPDVVRTFLETRDLAKARRVQLGLNEALEQDFSKHAPHAVVPRIRALWSSLPAQLARENRKFVYGVVRHGARAREYELALQWLVDCGLVHRVDRVAKPGMPLVAYQDLAAFKLFAMDVGLLGASSGLEIESVLGGNALFEEFKGALTEQYVLQQLISHVAVRPFYWSADRATAEVDFVVQLGGEVVPIEVKAAENLQAKSLKIYQRSFGPRRAVRTSLSPFREDGWLVNIPLFAIHELAGVLRHPPRPSR